VYLPIAVHVGELASRARADQAALLDWLRFRRDASEDPVERAHDLTREALLVSDGESDTASSLLEEALRARPADYALRDLLERLSPEPPADRASWREARAAETSGPDAARLAIEAAQEYERAADLEAAARCAKLAEANGDKDLAPIAGYRLALAGFGTAEVIDALLPKARETEDASERLEIYERLAELDERGRGDSASGLLFRRTILEENPSHLRTLRRVASALMVGGREDELEPVAMELARNLDGGEAVAYAAVAARLRLRAKWEDTAEPVAIAYHQTPRPLWALRQMAAHARARGDHLAAAVCDKELAGLTDRPIEKATLLTRAAEAHRAAGDLASARSELEEALTHFDGHVVARQELAELLVETGDAEAAAAHYEMLAGAYVVPASRAQADHRAGVLYQDQVGDIGKARAALERVLDVDPSDADTFDRLRTIYIAAGARSELADLLKRRLEGIEDPGERVEMEVMRGRALAEVGDADAAKRALAAALDANPDHVDALGAFADLCASDGDFGGAEEALIRLARLTSDPEKQVDIYFRLGALYDESLPNDERAEAAYQEILKRRPGDLPAREKLIALYRRTGQMARAVDEQNALVGAAESPDDKCQRTVELAEIMEEMGELKKAESTLVVARKSFPKSDLALRALVQFYQRTGQAPAAAVLLDRAVADARRALGTGRFENFLFETLATAAELRGRLDAAAVARATVQALDGDASDLAGVGLRAGDAKLDDLLAPEVMTPAFRDLLIRTGPLLDNAFPFDADAVRATPLPPPLAPLGEEIRALAGAYGLPQIMVMVSNMLGPVCVPVRSHPPTVLVGSALAQQPPSAERSFLLHRALKVIQANACVLARTAPIDLWPVVAALLKAFNPQFAPQGVDSGRFADAFGRISRAMPQGLGADMGVLASDVVGSIGNRASTLNSAINGWGSRAGLLAVGDPNVALTGIAWAGGNVSGPPPTGKDRVTWIGRNAEARDLVIFAVSDHYVDARQRLGA
jgi:tetratricopeptide (TPR) repeat protein